MVFADLSSIDFATACRAIGLIGFATYVTCFFGLCPDQIHRARSRYLAIVCLAGGCTMSGLLNGAGPADLLIEGTYILVALGVFLLFRPPTRRAWAER